MKAKLNIVFAASLFLTSTACLHTETPSANPPDAGEAIPFNPANASPASVRWSARSDYVAVNIPFESISGLKQAIEEREGVALKSRGEAHITVLAPQELTVLRTKMSLEQINGAVEKMSVQTVPIQLQCLGRGQLKQAGKKVSTYYLVVAAPGLSAVREKLRQQFVAAGGEKQALPLEGYYPHITVGFTDRDLHIADGVVKDAKSCVYQLAKPG